MNLYYANILCMHACMYVRIYVCMLCMYVMYVMDQRNRLYLNIQTIEGIRITGKMRHV